MENNYEPIALCDTKDMSEERWLECRAHGPNGDIPFTMGGSDTSAALGVNEYKSPQRFAQEKLGLVQIDAPNNPLRLMMGHLMEPIAAELFQRKMEESGLFFTVVNDTTLYQHPVHPYALANIDRVIIDQNGNKGILEIKTASYYKADDWADGKIPLYYENQIRFYMSVMNVSYGYFICVWGMDPEHDIAIVRVERDMAKEADMWDGLDEFIACLERGEIPKTACANPEVRKKELSEFRYSYGVDVDVELPPSAESLMQHYLEAERICAATEEKLKEDTARKTALQTQIAELLGAAERGVVIGSTKRYLINWSFTHRIDIDTAQLKKDNPELYEQLPKKEKSYRGRFIVKERGL